MGWTLVSIKSQRVDVDPLNKAKGAMAVRALRICTYGDARLFEWLPTKRTTTSKRYSLSARSGGW